MKKPIHLYIFAILSAVATVLRLFNSFVSSYNEAAVKESYASIGLSVTDDILVVLREQAAFSTNILNKILAVSLLLLLVGTIVFLFQKKNEKASYVYAIYLVFALIFNTYAYIGARSLAQLYSDEMMRQGGSTGAFWAYILQIVIFAVYFGLTLFFLFRKPKEKPSVAATATDS